MRELFRHSENFVYLDITGATADEGSVTAVCSTPWHDHADDLVVSGPEQIGDVQRWTATLGLPHTEYAEPIEVRWSFTINGYPTTKVDHFDIVVPTVSIDNIRDELDLGAETTDSEILRAERRARMIIERYCGQQFNDGLDTLVVRSSGDRLMRLPKRIISVDSVNSANTGLALQGWDIRENGWALLRTLDYHYGEELNVTGPIYNPFPVGSLYWPRGYEWVITGHWGWDRVPSEVSEAALMLVEQRLCPETQYRDNYIASMAAADWRYNYSSDAYRGTGNAVVDQILAPFQVVKMAVI